MRLVLGFSSGSDQCTTRKGLTSFAVLCDWQLQAVQITCLGTSLNEVRFAAVDQV